MYGIFTFIWVIFLRQMLKHILAPWSIRRFPKTGVPSVIIHFQMGFSLINHLFWGTHIWKLPYGKDQLVVVSRHLARRRWSQGSMGSPSWSPTVVSRRPSREKRAAKNGATFGWCLLFLLVGEFWCLGFHLKFLGMIPFPTNAWPADSSYPAPKHEIFFKTKCKQKVIREKHILVGCKPPVRAPFCLIQ